MDANEKQCRTSNSLNSIWFQLEGIPIPTDCQKTNNKLIHILYCTCVLKIKLYAIKLVY